MDHFLKLKVRYGAEEALDEYEGGVPPRSTTTATVVVRELSRLHSVRARTYASPNAPGTLGLGPVLIGQQPIEFGAVAADGTLSEPSVACSLLPGQSVSVVLVNDCEFALSCEVEVELDVVGEEK